MMPMLIVPHYLFNMKGPCVGVAMPISLRKILACHFKIIDMAFAERNYIKLV